MSGSSLGLLCLKITRTAFSGGWDRRLQEIASHYPSRPQVAIVLSLFECASLEEALRKGPQIGGPAWVVRNSEGRKALFYRIEVSPEIKDQFSGEEGEVLMFRVER